MKRKASKETEDSDEEIEFTLSKKVKTEVVKKEPGSITLNKKRIRILKSEEPSKHTGIVYWMWRDMRVQDNWALIYAQTKAIENNVPLHVVSDKV